MLPFEKSLLPFTGAIIKTQSLGGGCIHHATRILGEKGSFFIKWNELKEEANFVAEAKGLALLRTLSPLRVPQFVGHIREGNHIGLLLEYMESGQKSTAFYQQLGEGLARQHLQTQPLFGLDHNNFIGALPQRNPAHQHWADFFREARIFPQIQLPQAVKFLDATRRKRLHQLLQQAENLFPDEPPALLHGDLWGGNLLCDAAGSPVLIDPAVYYGHREMELAFMQLFDSYPEAFYAAYQEVYPLTSGWKERMDLYNLYPMLVHLNLFGGSYLGGVERIIHKYG